MISHAVTSDDMIIYFNNAVYLYDVLMYFNNDVIDYMQINSALPSVLAIPLF